MKIYWGFGSIPELADLPKAQQKQLWRACFPQVRRRPLAWVGYAMMMVLVTGVGFILPQIVDFIPSTIIARALWGGLWGGIGAWIANQFVFRAIRPLLAARRAAMAPQRQHDDGSYWVPPAP